MVKKKEKNLMMIRIRKNNNHNKWNSQKMCDNNEDHQGISQELSRAK
jgi:hypothetical protein